MFADVGASKFVRSRQTLGWEGMVDGILQICSLLGGSMKLHWKALGPSLLLETLCWDVSRNCKWLAFVPFVPEAM
jgi:hypothetical protein